MASSRCETGASTPGASNLGEIVAGCLKYIGLTADQLREAALECLKCGQLNIGLAIEESSGPDLTFEIQACAAWLPRMCKHVHVVVLNELHINLQDQFKNHLRPHPNLEFLGWSTGDAVVWRRST